jgi:hypothetical protein
MGRMDCRSPKEFYFRYFHLFQDSFVQVLNSSYQKGVFTQSQRYGLVTLSCKDESKADQLSRWRPISLLNCDYKILTKILSKRLSSVLATCIDKDQTFRTTYT